MREAAQASIPAATRRIMGGVPQAAVHGESSRDACFRSLSSELRFRLDDDGRFTYLEGAWQATLGRDSDELLGAHWSDVVAPIDTPRMRRAIERVLRSGSLQKQLDVRMPAAADGPRLVRWTLVAGAPSDAIVAVGRDRTAEHGALAGARRDLGRLERHTRDLEAQVTELTERSRSVERFAAVAAHQLSEPLIVAESGAILVAEELGDELDPDLRDRLDAIGRGAARARQVIDALLIDARAGSTRLDLAPVAVGPVVDQVLENMSERLSERRIEAEVGPLPTVRAEPRLLGVIYQNLLSNALKYGPRDGGRIRFGADERAGGWRLTVTGAGAPITEHDAERIFEPFRRVPGERRAPGTGLGLAICARLVGRLGGTIGVEPHADGNCFFFVLPAAA